MTELSLEVLLKSGAHFGHKASRWNPKMAPYIFTVRNKFHIINLEQTYEKIKDAQAFITAIVRAGGTVLFVGTKRQARAIVKHHAQACGMPFVITRWLGGTLTNFKTIQRSMKKLARLEELLAGPVVGQYTKKERLMMQREVAKNSVLFEGLRTLKKFPEAMYIVDTNTDAIAVNEARFSKIKIIGITDTNSDPSVIDFPIPANDDAIKTIELVTACMAEAVLAGRIVEGSQTAPLPATEVVADQSR